MHKRKQRRDNSKEQTERVGPDPVEELHKGEGEVEAEKTQQVPRGGI